MKKSSIAILALIAVMQLMTSCLFGLYNTEKEDDVSYYYKMDYSLNGVEYTYQEKQAPSRRTYYQPRFSNRGCACYDMEQLCPQTENVRELELCLYSDSGYFEAGKQYPFIANPSSRVYCDAIPNFDIIHFDSGLFKQGWFSFDLLSEKTLQYSLTFDLVFEQDGVDIPFQGVIVFSHWMPHKGVPYYSMIIGD